MCFFVVLVFFIWSAKSFEVQIFLIESFWHKRSAVGGCFSIGQTCLIDKCLHQRHLSDKEVMFATRQQAFCQQVEGAAVKLSAYYGAREVTCWKNNNNPWGRFCNPSPQFINRTDEFSNCSLGLTNRAHLLINRTHEFLIRALRFVNRAFSFCNLYPQIHKPCPRFRNPFPRVCKL